MHLLARFLLFVLAAVPAIAAEPSLLGVWEARIDGLPVATVALRDVGGRLEGSVVFCLFRRQDGKAARVERRAACPMLSVWRDVASVVFEVSHAGAPQGESAPRGPSVSCRINHAGKARFTPSWLNHFLANSPPRLVGELIQ
jgi:hypothetical protein